MIWPLNPKHKQQPAAPAAPAPIETFAPQSPPTQPELLLRMRRNRKSEWTRRLVRENELSCADLIWPIFICEGVKLREPIASMPGVDRLSIDVAVDAAREAQNLGIPAIALFPHTDPSLRDEAGSEALNPDNLICRAVRAIKEMTPGVGLITDVALDPYTSHGHDGLLRGEEILNDETVEVLVQQALNQARAGADMIAPSDMMDGRVRAIRAGTRRRRLSVRADPRLCGEIRLGLLWPVSRRHWHQGDAHRRQAHLSDGPRQCERGAARSGAGHRRGRRHRDGQARPALSRHYFPGEGRNSAPRPSPIRCRANMR